MQIALIVEDEWLLRAPLAEDLNRLGWTVLEAASAEEALDILRASCQIDLLVTDIRLGGGLSGWDVAEAFREQQPEAAVIYVTANQPEAARQVPRSAFISKPCAVGDIIDNYRALQRHAHIAQVFMPTQPMVAR